jgi:probable F420-dependent oxidoreductase
MPHDRRFRFGIQLSRAASATDWTEQARRAEDLGYATLFVPDHFDDQLGPLTATTVAATATSELRVGALVYGNDYRHPVVLAKELATLDLLSGGRVELGLGAGWMRTDYERAGIPYEPAGTRVDRLEEAVAVLKGLFSGEPFSLTGTHYRIEGLTGTPAPAQRPHPPFLIGGGGRRVLTIAARDADIVGVNPTLKAGEVGAEAALDASAAATDRKVGWVRDAAAERWDDLELNVLVFAAAVTDDRAGMAELLAPMFSSTPEEVLESPHVIAGTVEEIAETLEARRDRWGFSYVVVQGDAMDGFAPIVARLTGT